MYNTGVFASIAIYGHSRHQSHITIEFILKNASKRCTYNTCVSATLAIYGFIPCTCILLNISGVQECVIYGVLAHYWTHQPITNI